MFHISVSANTYSQVTLLTSAWSVSEDQVVTRLLEAFKDSRSAEQPNQKDPDLLPVTADYAGTYIRGMFHLSSGRLDILGVPLQARALKRPAAACAVVQADQSAG